MSSRIASTSSKGTVKMAGECNIPPACDKKCSSHEACEKGVASAISDVNRLEVIQSETSIALSKLDGRFTIFTWVTGLLLVAMLGFSLYGVVQISSFKEVYYKDMLQLQKTILEGQRK